MGLFDRFVARLTKLAEAPKTIAEASAERIEAKLRADATTRRGNVPQFGPGAKGHPGGYVPISVTAKGGTIDVKAADWVLAKAREKGQPEEWAAIVREETRKAMK